MPRGTVYTETGIIDQENGLYALRRDEGGTWRLDAGTLLGYRLKRFKGHRVQLVGTRVDFDVLDVTAIERID